MAVALGTVPIEARWLENSFRGEVVGLPLILLVFTFLVPLAAQHQLSEGWRCPDQKRPPSHWETRFQTPLEEATASQDQRFAAADSNVIDHLPEFAGKSGHEQVTIRHLLTHSSGLHVRRRLFLETQDRTDLLNRVYDLVLLSVPGEVAVYRDYKMLLLGEIVQRAAGQPLDRFFHENVFTPVGMKDTSYVPRKRLRPRIAPSEFDRSLRKRVVEGEVRDENCFILGGVCGYAGLFSTAPDLSIFASPNAIIHTGFTGTSLYIDPQRDAFVVLLTNRVHAPRANQKYIEARVAVHNAVLGELERQDLGHRQLYFPGNEN